MTTEFFNEFASELDGPAPVSDVLARGIPIRWDEAIALLQEIIETITAGGGEDGPIPAFEDVLVDEEGAVRITATRRGERGPVAAGRALHALLATADVPVALRLFVTQANAPETHSSLRAFADGLAYFGKPGRADLIKAIYDRYRSTAASVATSQDKAASSPSVRDQVHDPRAHKPRRAIPQWLLPAAVVLGIASLAAVIWFGVLGPRGANTASIVTRAKSALASVAPSIASAPTSTAGATPPLAEAPGRQSENASSRAGSRRQAASDGVAPTAVEARSSVAPPVAPIQNPASMTPAPTPKAEESPAIAIPVTREVVVAPRESAATTIYSPADPDVQPPVMMYPSLPPAVFVAKNADTVVINRMELVIAADGSVERVRLVNGPSRMPDMMLLSGAKLWRFTPAMKDGVPVRFRTTVTWTGFP